MNQSDVFHVDISPCHMSHVIHFEFSLSEEICIEKSAEFVLFCSHCIQLLFGSPPCLKMNGRRYSDVVSGSGKFIFAVSTGYLFGMCKRFYLTTCNRMSLRVIGLRVRAAVQVGNLSTL